MKLQLPQLIRIILVLYWVAGGISPGWASSQTVIGIITEVVQDVKKDSFMRLQLLWDSNGIAENVMNVNLKSRYGDCVILLDGKPATDEEAFQPGRLIQIFFNRKSMKRVDCVTIPQNVLTQLRPPGKEFLVVNAQNAVGPASKLVLYLSLVDNKINDVLAVAPDRNMLACDVSRYDLIAKDNKLTGTVEITIPAREGKNPLPTLTASYRVELPVKDGDGVLTGQCEDIVINSKATVRAYAVPPVPEHAALWVWISDNNFQLTVQFKNGVALTEHAYVVFCKGDIRDTLKNVQGTLTNEQLTFSAEGERGEPFQNVRLKGKVLGDRVSGEFTAGEKTGRFIGGILPVNCLPLGYLAKHKSSIIADDDEDKKANGEK